jgi:hypothetical protein
MDWWLSFQDSKNAGAAQSAFDAYRQHLATIRDRFPAQLLDIDERSVLHDGVVRGIISAYSSHTLNLSATVDDGSGGASEIELCYQGVRSFRVLPWSGDWLPPRAGFGDMGYAELDVTGDGDLLHRILFSSGIEIEIKFQQFELR